VILTGLDVPKNPVFMRVYGLYHFSPFAFATFLQLFDLKNAFFAKRDSSKGFAS